MKWAYVCVIAVIGCLLSGAAGAAQETQQAPSGDVSPDQVSRSVVTKKGLRFTFATRTYVNAPGVVDTDQNPHRYPGYPQVGRLVGNQADVNPDRANNPNFSKVEELMDTRFAAKALAQFGVMKDVLDTAEWMPAR